MYLQVYINLFLDITRPIVQYIYGMGYVYNSGSLEYIYYYRGCNRYCVLIKHKRNIPSLISKVVGVTPKGEEVDITDSFLEYMGPYSDFHNSIKLTPESLGYDKIIITELCDDVSEFNSNEQITL